MSFLKPPINFSLNIASPFGVMTHKSSVIFSSNIVYFGQKEPIKVQILKLSSVGSKFAKFLMSFFKAQVNFSSIFASFFSVTTPNSSVLFWLKQYTFGKSRLLSALMKVHLIPHVISETVRSRFFQIFHHCSVA